MFATRETEQALANGSPNGKFAIRFTPLARQKAQ